MLISNDLVVLQEDIEGLYSHLQAQGWAINPQKIQGPGPAIKFLRVTWLDKTHLIPGVVVDKIPCAKDVKINAGFSGNSCARDMTLLPT